MNMEQGLKDVTAGADAADVLKSVNRLFPVESGVVAELLLTDLDTGEVTVELGRFDQVGRCGTAVTLRGAPDEAERRIIDALVKGTGLELALISRRGIAVQSGGEALAAAITRLSPGAEARLHQADDWGVVHAPYGSSVNIVGRDGTMQLALDTAPMALGGRRQITAACVAAGVLHVAVSDPVAGFDLYRCDLDAGATVFGLALSRGAYRFALNGAVAAMTGCERGVLVGTAALAGMAMPVGDWGPELILVTADGGWDLVVGQPRFTPDGMMLPASGLTPGLGKNRNAAIKAIAHADGVTMIAIQDFAGQSQPDRRETRADFFDYRGPVRLYRSSDLVEWQPVAHSLPHDADPVTALAMRGRHLYVGCENLSGDGVPVRVVAL